MSYKHWNNRKFGHKAGNKLKLVPGTKGFLCTCTDKLREKDCVKEAYNLLNEYSDLFYGPEKPREVANKDTEPVGTSSNNDEIDIDAALKKEISDLKWANDPSVYERRFKAIDSGANGIVFIKTTLVDPAELSHKILSSIAETKQRKSKTLLRLLPVQATSKAFLDDIVDALSPLLDVYFTQEPKQYSIVYNHRNNNNMDRDQLIETLAALVFTKNPEHKANLKEPDLVILVEIIRNVCCLAIVPDYFKLKKYNLLEVAKEVSIDPSKKEPTENVEQSSTEKAESENLQQSSADQAESKKDVLQEVSQS